MGILSPIGDGLMLVRGNHEDVYGEYKSGDTTNSYVNKVAPSKIWNKLHRPQAKDLRRVFGGDGTYFYLDNTPQKVRFICLNSHFYNGDEVTNGTTKFMTFGFGTEQLEWLENVALSVENDWSVVIATHYPFTDADVNLKAENKGTGYLYTFNNESGGDGTKFRNIISSSSANILGIFCGHCHSDGYVIDDLRCPIVTITSAINTPYDADWSTRVAGTANETAIDIVSIDKVNNKIYTTRLGAGIDREIDF
jgi:hypothetical protein